MTEVKKVKFFFYKSQKVYPKPVFNGIYMNPLVICVILLYWELNIFSCMSVDWVSKKFNKISATHNYKYGYMAILWYIYKINKIIYMKRYP